MRLRLLCAIGVLIFLIDTAPAQKRNNNQLIQYSLNAAGLGMDFSYQPPFIQTRFAANPGDCLSVISDTNGRMLFAAAPGLIYDTTGAVIYDDVTPYYYAIGATQSTLILPRPAHSATYDVVMFQSTPSVTQNVKATWTSVDMSMNGGLGGSTGHWTFGQHFTEGLTGCPHKNGVDYWVVMHEWGSDALRAYHETENGLDTVPVISHCGTAHSATWGSCTEGMNADEEMKIDYSGNFLALCTTDPPCASSPYAHMTQQSIVQLFRFDAMTGEATYWMDLPGHHLSYSVDFSHDGSKVYVSGADSSVAYVDQYDLTYPDTNTIKQSRFRVCDTILLFPDDLSSALIPIEDAPDGKLYVSRGNERMDIIEHPDSAGPTCTYIRGALLLQNTDLFHSHWNHLKRYQDSEFVQSDQVHGVGPREVLRIWPNPTNSTCWLSLPRAADHCALQLIDATGRSAKTWSGLMPGIRSLDLDGFGSGAYVIVLRQGSTIINHARLVIE